MDNFRIENFIIEKNTNFFEMSNANTQSNWYRRCVCLPVDNLESEFINSFRTLK